MVVSILYFLSNHRDDVTVKDSESNVSLEKLNHHEIACLRYYSEGLPFSEIAIKIKRSEFSVSLFLRSAKNKMNAKNIGHAVALAFKSKLL